ncbi:MAG: alpha/beta fold hydrolase [Promethearchaeota archaeon]
MARAYRQLAEASGNDLLALAALVSGTLRHELNEIFNSPTKMRKALRNIKVPVMTVVSSSEIIPGDKTIVAQLVPDACHFQIQGKDHMTMTSDPKFHMVVKAFLDFVNRK